MIWEANNSASPPSKCQRSWYCCLSSPLTCPKSAVVATSDMAWPTHPCWSFLQLDYTHDSLGVFIEFNNLHSLSKQASRQVNKPFSCTVSCKCCDLWIAWLSISRTLHGLGQGFICGSCGAIRCQTRRRSMYHLLNNKHHEIFSLDSSCHCHLCDVTINSQCRKQWPTFSSTKWCCLDGCLPSWSISISSIVFNHLCWFHQLK